MVDIGTALESDAGVKPSERKRTASGFLLAHPDHYRRLAECICDLISAHPVQGPEEVAGMLECIEQQAWRGQDRLPDRSTARRQEVEAWRHRRKERPTETEHLIDLLRGGA